MSPVFSQAGKLMSITTPLGADVLLLERAVIDERVSGGFELTLDLLSTQNEIAVDSLLRKPVSVKLSLPENGSRYFHGLVRRFILLGRDQELYYYRAEVVPATWFLSLKTDCRIYQHKTVPQIITAVLSAVGIPAPKNSLSGTHAAREYCVQYRESDLAFISRLMEEEGIFYFFEHTADGHTMVLADSVTAVKPGPVPKVPMYLGGEGAYDDHIVELEIRHLVRSGKVTLTDYNDTLPRRMESSVATTTHTTSRANLRVYDYPGKYEAPDDGNRIARLRMEEYESEGMMIVGRSSSPGLASGHVVEITHHFRSEGNAKFTMLSVHHEVQVAGYRTLPKATPLGYSASFVGIPASVPYRPPRVTPKSIVHGTQTALVVGPSGEEIYVDKYGRVKVQFFWDEVGTKDENSSCWVRVSSAWAGKGWGFIQLPRIGQEVIVDFLDGDPDRPIVTGRVYNAEMMPPYTLPDSSTQSGVKSRSSKDGTADTANEFRFEDKKGSELVTFQAEKDLSSVVKNDETREVKHDRTTTIKNNETKTVSDGNEATTISKGDQTLTIDQGKQTVTIDKDQAITIKQGNHSFTVTMGNVATKVDQGNVTLKVALGKITYEAMQGIELKVGQSSITIDQSGIKIKGMMVSVEGQVQTQIKGAITQVNGDGMLQLKGGITMIN